MQDSQFQGKNINFPLHGKFVWQSEGQTQPRFWGQGFLWIFLTSIQIPVSSIVETSYLDDVLIWHTPGRPYSDFPVVKDGHVTEF